jgi:y4mF family transcriptional regulator
MNNLSAFIKYHRKKRKLSQEQLASNAGVGLRFVREIEQGKETLQLDKVNQVLSLFGFNLYPSRPKVDAYEVYWKYLNKAVQIELFNKVIKSGMLVKEIIDQTENKISGWQFVSMNHAVKYLQKPDEKLTEIILHSDIYSIEEQ